MSARSCYYGDSSATTQKLLWEFSFHPGVLQSMVLTQVPVVAVMLVVLWFSVQEKRWNYVWYHNWHGFCFALLPDYKFCCEKRFMKHLVGSLIFLFLYILKEDGGSWQGRAMKWGCEVFPQGSLLWLLGGGTWSTPGAQGVSCEDQLLN